MNTQQYSARITRKTPSAFVFMLDLSGSMDEKIRFNGETATKASAVSSIINSTLMELILHCRREEGYRDYLDIAVIGYGGDQVRSLLPEGGSHPVFRKPGELAYARVDTVKTFRERILPDGQKSLSTLERKAWVKPHAQGKTPMFAAFEEVYKLIGGWTKQHAQECCFPPVVIHITDGEATDAETPQLLAAAEKLRGLKTEDGNVLLMNIYIGSESEKQAVLFPASADELPDTPYARQLFEMSSLMPEIYRERIGSVTGSRTPEGCRGISYNTSMTDLVSLLNIGSVSLTLLS